MVWKFSKLFLGFFSKVAQMAREIITNPYVYVYFVDVFDQDGKYYYGNKVLDDILVLV